MRQCLIHLGFPKTGTTSIQESLFLNRDYLRENGVYYPSFQLAGQSLGRYACHVFQSVTRDYSEIQPFWRLGRARAELRNYGITQLDRVIREFQASGCPMLLLSSELLPGQYFGSFADILVHDIGTIRGLFYVRSPLSGFRSRFQQGLRGGQFHKPIMAVRQKIMQAQEYFPIPLAVRKYHERSEGGKWDVVDDFWSDVLALHHRPIRADTLLNEADPAEITIIFAEMTERLSQLSFDQRTEFYGWCRNQFNAMIDIRHNTTRFDFSEAVSRKILAASSLDRAWLKERYGIEWDGLTSAETCNEDEEIIHSAEHLRREVTFSPEVCDAICAHFLERMAEGLPRSVDARAVRNALLATRSSLR